MNPFFRRGSSGTRRKMMWECVDWRVNQKKIVRITSEFWLRNQLISCLSVEPTVSNQGVGNTSKRWVFRLQFWDDPLIKSSVLVCRGMILKYLKSSLEKDCVPMIPITIQPLFLQVSQQESSPSFSGLFLTVYDFFPFVWGLNCVRERKGRGEKERRNQSANKHQSGVNNIPWILSPSLLLPLFFISLLLSFPISSSLFLFLRCEKEEWEKMWKGREEGREKERCVPSFLDFVSSHLLIGLRVS